MYIIVNICRSNKKKNEFHDVSVMYSQISRPFEIDC